MLISVIGQKGGVGKSTIVRLIATDLKKVGWSVRVADFDTGNSTCLRWTATRFQKGIEPVISVQSYASAKAIITDTENFDVVIVDGPGASDQGALTIARHSDLVIMPTATGRDDVDTQIGAAEALIRAGVDKRRIRFVFARYDHKPTRIEKLEKRKRQVRLAGLKPLSVGMPSYSSIEDALDDGKAPSEVSQYHVKVLMTRLVLEIEQAIRDIIELNTEEEMEANHG